MDLHVTLDVNHHFPSSPADQALKRDLLQQLVALQAQGTHIMSKLDELEAELVIANTTTNEIADDITDLLNKLATGGLTAAEADQVKADIQALNARLMGVAAQHTP